MKLTSDSFAADGPIPDRCAFAKPETVGHATLSENRNPHLAWPDVPSPCKTFVVVCTDIDALSVADDVNVEGRVVSKDLARGEFHHWIMVDVPAQVTSIGEGECSSEVVPRGKPDPQGPRGARQGITGFTDWFANDPDMAGIYRGYDGPGPPWNDERVHRYRFTVYATDLARCDVDADFTVTDALAAIEGHVLEAATIIGTYTLNPALR